MKRSYCTIVLFSLSLAACGGGDASSSGASNGAAKPSAGQDAAPMAAKEAQDLYASLCFTCHGLTGLGDGPGAAALNPKPRTFADPAWQDSVTDDQIQKAIVYGGAAVGKSPVMPAQPQLKGKTETLKALTKIVRAFRAQ